MCIRDRNIRSLPKHFDNFQDLLTSLNCRFKIIGLSETRLTSSSCIPHNLELEGYSLTSNRTEASAGGTSIYVCNTLSYKLRNDLSTMLYFPKQLESTFIEISRNGKRNIIVGCIYKHPGMPITHFTDFYMTPLLNKINTEKKIGFLLGDFNIDLLEFNNNEVGKYIDSLTSLNFFPTISLPTRITDTTATVIDNIFVSPHENTYESGNLLTGISDHLAQFIFPVGSSTIEEQNTMLTYRDWKALDPIRLSESFKKIDWNKILSLEKNDPDYSFCRFFDKLTILIDSHVPLKKMSKKQRNSLSKPWMTNEIRKSIRTRDSLLKKFKKEKRPNKKTELYNEYRFLRNRIVSQIRQSKLDHYRKFFNDNMKNSKRIWNGIREIISLKSKNKANRLSLDIDGHLISDQKEIAESLNNFFAQIADNIKSKLPP